MDHLAALSQATTSSDDRERMLWAEAVHTALVQALGDAPGAIPGPHMIRKLVGAQSAWAPVAALRAAALRGDSATPAQHLALHRLLADLLVARARSVARFTGAPLSAKLATNCVGDLPGCLEAAYPGYAASGLLPLVLGRIASGEAAM